MDATERLKYDLEHNTHHITQDGREMVAVACEDVLQMAGLFEQFPEIFVQRDSKVILTDAAIEGRIWFRRGGKSVAREESLAAEQTGGGRASRMGAWCSLGTEATASVRPSPGRRPERIHDEAMPKV